MTWCLQFWKKNGGDLSTMNKVLKWSATKMAKAIKQQKISSEELVQLHLERIEEVNPKINAIFKLNDNAFQEAKNADAELAQSTTLGPLHGVPFSVKDWIDTAGLPCAGANVRYLNRMPKEDATVVARLREAGGILLCKTTVTANSEAYGKVCNPYNLDFSPWGSSSGEAALIASSGSPLGLGSDSGGSIRQPAHVCGIAGLKPTSGRVPLTGHFPPIVPLNDPRTVIGPMARYVEDLAYVLPIIAGQDWRDSSVIPMPLGNYRKVDLSKLNVTFYTQHANGSCSPDTLATVHKVAEYLGEVCRVVEEKLPPRSEEIFPITKDYWNRLESTDMNEWIGEGANKLDGAAVAKHLFEWDRFRRSMLAFIKDWDVIITPAAESPALPHGVDGGSIDYTLAYSLTGYPCGVVRAGTSTDGLPIGVQVVGRPWRDDVVLAVMREIEEGFGGWKKPPL
jgi:amidase